VTEPEEEQEKTQKTDAVLKPPTANPTRTRVRDADQKARNAAQQSERNEQRRAESTPTDDEEEP
jgi:hypothetical protein